MPKVSNQNANDFNTIDAGGRQRPPRLMDEFNRRLRSKVESEIDNIKIRNNSLDDADDSEKSRYQKSSTRSPILKSSNRDKSPGRSPVRGKRDLDRGRYDRDVIDK